jgi:hypothetical protein
MARFCWRRADGAGAARCAAAITAVIRRSLPPPLIFVFADFISLMLRLPFRCSPADYFR